MFNESPPPGSLPRGLKRFHLTEPTTFRLIPTAYIIDSALDPLAKTKEDRSILEDLEVLTSRRQDREMPLPSAVRRSELLSDAHGFGYTYVNAAFCYTRPKGSRFNGVDRGAWYASWGPGAVETSLSEITWHLTRELDNVDHVDKYKNITRIQELLAGFTAQFADLREDGSADYLHEDPAIGYPAGQDLARELRAAGCAGVIYPSARKTGGFCLAAFRLNLVQNVRHGDRWELTWSGSRDPVITKIT